MSMLFRLALAMAVCMATAACQSDLLRCGIGEPNCSVSLAAHFHGS